jgi:ABC-type uncharacterized transport system permease subunit
MNTVLLSVSTISFYALATLLLALRWRGTWTAGAMPGGGASFPAGVALVLHALLAARFIFGGEGIDLGIGASLILFTWLITLIAVVIDLTVTMRFLGLIMFPVSVLSIIAALALPETPQTGHQWSLALEVHILLSVFAYCTLSIAALLALVLAVQDHQLHHHKEGPLLRNLPPLQTVEHLLFRLIEIGFVLLSFALVSGFLFTEDLFTHKIVFSVVAWIVFFVLLLGRHFAGWRGQIAIRWTFGGVVALMLAFFGTKIVFELILG